MPDPTDFLLKHIPHIVGIGLLPFVGWGLKLLAVNFWEKITGTISAVDRKITNSDANLEKMMTNHLPHMQASLDTMTAEQRQTNLLMAEQNGYLKGILEKK
jgi:hypothetical protein